MLKKIKVPLALIILTFFIITLGWGKYELLKNGTNSLLSTTKMMEDYLHSDNWQEAELQFITLQNKWDRIKTYWPMFIDHGEMDRIEESMSKLSGYLENEALNETIAELYTLSYFIRHIPEKEALNLKNIF